MFEKFVFVLLCECVCGEWFLCCVCEVDVCVCVECGVGVCVGVLRYCWLMCCCRVMCGCVVMLCDGDGVIDGCVMCVVFGMFLCDVL